MSHPAISIANEFIKRANSCGKPLTHMQLQKLVYLAHGWNLAIHDRPLINDQVEAWHYGTVIRRLYDALKKYKAQPISELIKWGDDTPCPEGDQIDGDAYVELCPYEEDVMRRGEILALRWKNVDLEKRTIRIVESLEQTKNGLRFKSPKTEKTRAVILPDYVAEKLLTLKEQQAKLLAEEKVRQTAETLVCSRWDGEPVHPRTITHKFVAAIKRLPNLPRVRFHDLRHSHATQLLAAGIHPKIAQERLGHSSITTTLDLYSHVTNTMQSDAASKLDSAFRSAAKNTNQSPKPQLG